MKIVIIYSLLTFASFSRLYAQEPLKKMLNSYVNSLNELNESKNIKKVKNIEKI